MSGPETPRPALSEDPQLVKSETYKEVPEGSATSSTNPSDSFGDSAVAADKQNSGRSYFSSDSSASAGAPKSRTRQLPNGDTYEGGWQNGHPEGTGIYRWADGSHYEGSWLAGKKHGRGMYQWPSGAQYEGDWVHGFMQGVGTYKSKDGTQYAGSWLRDEKHGLGTKKYANGDMYEGLWKNGKPGGPGMYRWIDKSEYNGEWVQGRMHGRGTFIWPTGERYDGEWTEGRENGRGVFTWADSSFFDGLWALGLKHGIGVWSPPLELKKDVHSPTPKKGSVTESGMESEGEGVDLKDLYTIRRMMLQEYSEGQLLREEVASQTFCAQYQPPYSVVMSALKSKDAKKLKRKKKKKQKQVGETIFKGHRSYDLMLNLQLGIRWSVGRMNPAEDRDINSTDFTQVIGETSFPREGSDETPPHPSGDFKWKDYYPMVFRKLRERFGLDAGLYVNSLCGDTALRELSSPGKSGSIFFLSHDDRFIIKTMKKEEMTKLRQLLPKYLAHVQQHQHTLLTKFFGLHRIKPHKGRKVRFVVMGNLLATDLHIQRRYDLKGSWLGRYTDKSKQVEETTILKDLDLDMVFKLESGWRDKMLEQIRVDCQLLEVLGVMDYSLLLGVHFRDTSNPALAAKLAVQSEMSQDSGTETEMFDDKTARSAHLTLTGEVSGPLSSVDEEGSSASTQKQTTLVSKEGAIAKALNYRPWKAHTNRSLQTVAASRPGRTMSLRPISYAEGSTDAMAQIDGLGTVALGSNIAATAIPQRVMSWPDKEAGEARPALLDGPADVVLHFGVIDILQDYNVTKQVEHSFKSLIHTVKSISSCDPIAYSKRLQSYMEQVFL